MRFFSKKQNVCLSLSDMVEVLIFEDEPHLSNPTMIEEEIETIDFHANPTGLNKRQPIHDNYLLKEQVIRLNANKDVFLKSQPIFG